MLAEVDVDLDDGDEQRSINPKCGYVVSIEKCIEAAAQMGIDVGRICMDHSLGSGCKYFDFVDLGIVRALGSPA